jgi:hypothetical protein
MPSNTHYFVVEVDDHTALKQRLEQAKINAIIYLCEDEYFGRGEWKDLPHGERWLIVDTKTENWERLAGLVDRAVEIFDYESEFWGLTIWWRGEEARATYWAPHLGKEDTALSEDELGFMARFFNREKSTFMDYLHYDFPQEFCDAVGIPFFEALDQDVGMPQIEARYPAGYVLYSTELGY